MGFFQYLFGLARNGLGGLWSFANFWRVSPLEGVRTGSSLAGGLLFLFLLFCIIGVVLVILGWVFGFTLDDVDGWIANAGPSLDFVGKVLIQKVLMGFVLLCCVALAAAMVFDRKGSGAPGWGMTILILLGCLMVGYCSTVNMVAPLDPYNPAITYVPPNG